MGKPVVHFDIGCKDKDKTRDFYCRVTECTCEPYGPYSFKLNTGSEAGIPGAATTL